MYTQFLRYNQLPVYVEISISNLKRRFSGMYIFLIRLDCNDDRFFVSQLEIIISILSYLKCVASQIDALLRSLIEEVNYTSNDAWILYSSLITL